MVLAGFAATVLISWLGDRQGWSALTTFVVTAAILAALAVARRGITRPIMVALIFLQAIPVFGLAVVARVAPLMTIAGLTVMWRIYVGKLHRSRVVPRADNEVAPGARGFVNHLLRLGFQIVGSVHATGPGYETVFTYLVSSDRRTFAVATDRVQTLASLFGPRIFVTMDRASLPVPPVELRQLVTADLPELYDAHKRALAVISAQGYAPDHLHTARVVASAIDHERISLEFLGARPWWVAGQVALGVIRRRPPDAGPITEDEASTGRVARWMGAS